MDLYARMHSSFEEIEPSLEAMDEVFGHWLKYAGTDFESLSTLNKVLDERSWYWLNPGTEPVGERYSSYCQALLQHVHDLPLPADVRCEYLAYL